MLVLLYSEYFIPQSEVQFTGNYSYETNNFGRLLLATNDYSYNTDHSAYNFGYSLKYGIVFSGFYHVSHYSQIWHLASDNS